MKQRLLALSVSIVLLTATWVGILSTPKAATAAQDSASTVLSAAAAVATAEPTVTPSGVGGLARFDEAAGVFSVRYPREFRQIRQLQGSSDTYGYTFMNSAGDAGLAVGFLVLSDKALSDGEWSLTSRVLGPETLLKEFGDIFNAGFSETTRDEGAPGTHTLYWEGAASSSGRSIALRLEESEGVLATIAIVAVDDQWTQRKDAFSTSLESLAWVPEAVREQIAAAGTNQDESTATEPAGDIVVEASPEGSETPEGTEAVGDIVIEASPEVSETPEATEAVGEIVIEPPPEGGQTPEAAETPADTETLGDIDVVESTEIADATGTPESGATTEETDVVTDQTPVSEATVDFEDPNGVFSISYPAEFNTTTGPSVSDGLYQYIATGDDAHAVAVMFVSWAGAAVSDDMWQQSVDQLAQVFLSNMASDATEEYRSIGDPGDHWLYVEAESKSTGARALYYITEDGGMVAIVLGTVPSNEWSDWKERLVSAVDSFQWSSDAARRAVGGGEPAQPEPTAVPEPTARPKPTSPPPPPNSPAIPAGKGALVMLNCRGDVVTVDVLPDGAFQELGPKVGNDCHRGEPIFLSPGQHTLKAAIAGVPSQGESTITIVAGQYLEFTWY